MPGEPQPRRPRCSVGGPTRDIAALAMYGGAPKLCRQSLRRRGCRLFSSNKLQATTCFSGMLWLLFYIRAAMQWRETIMAVVVSRLELLQTTASMPFPAPSESIEEKLFGSQQPAFLYVSGSLFYLHWLQHVYLYSSPSFLSSPMRRKQASSVSETTKVKIS